MTFLIAKRSLTSKFSFSTDLISMFSFIQLSIENIYNNIQKLFSTFQKHNMNKFLKSITYKIKNAKNAL